MRSLLVTGVTCCHDHRRTPRTSGDELERYDLLIRRHLATGDLAATADSRMGLPISSRGHDWTGARRAGHRQA
jgi:hypothetical protein